MIKYVLCKAYKLCISTKATSASIGLFNPTIHNKQTNQVTVAGLSQYYLLW